jgi:hypothetical protein
MGSQRAIYSNNYTKKIKKTHIYKKNFSHIRAKYEFPIYLSKKINSIINFIQIQTSSNLCIQYCGFIVKQMGIIFFLLHKHFFIISEIQNRNNLFA